MADQSFLKELDAACESALVALGFKRPRRGTIFLEIRPDFLGWVGLNIGNHGDMVRVNPNIGIHCERIERLRCELSRGVSYKKGKSATYVLPLGTQVPKEMDAFRFMVGAPLEPEARRLSLVIGEYGVPWMVKHASYESLIPVLEQSFSKLPNYPWRLAAAYFYAGYPERAARFTHDVLRKFEIEGEDVLLNHFKPFAEPFLQMVEAGSSSPM